MIYGYIYKITNIINNKVYIGQTTRTVEARFQEHLHSCTQKSKATLHLYSAMNLYGKENFSVEMIDTAISQDDLNKKEIYWIEFYDSMNAGYNMTKGGSEENPMNSEIVRKKHAKKLRSKEVRQKISKTLHELRTTQGFSAEHLKKLSEAAKNQIYFYKDALVTHINKNNIEKINILLGEGWLPIEKKAKSSSKTSKTKNKAVTNKNSSKALNNLGKIKTLATRSIGCYCIINTGETFYFDSILEAGLWWYNNYKPFGETYSDATYQRKIKASIAGKPITFGNKTHNSYKEVTNIRWYKKTN